MCIRDRSPAFGDVGRQVDRGADNTEFEVGGLHRARTGVVAVSYTHLRAHETVLDIVCRLLLEKKHYMHTTSMLTRPRQKQQIILQ